MAPKPPVARRKRPKLRARIIVIIWTYLRQAFFFVGHLTRQKQQWKKKETFFVLIWHPFERLQEENYGRDNLNPLDGG